MTSEHTVRNAAGWSILSGLITQVGQVVVTLVLAAILGPERFGVVALATLYLLLVDFLIKQGVAQALIQRADLRDGHLDSAFVMIMATALTLSIGTLIGAPLIADLFHAPALTNLLRVMAGVSILKGSWEVPAALLERDLDFKGRALAFNSAVTFGGLAGVIAAFSGADEYSVAFQLYVQGMVAIPLFYRRTRWRPHFRFEAVAAKELLSFSSGALLASLGAFVSQRADTIVVGIFFGPLAVGLYRFASRLVQLVTNLTAGSLGRVGLASLSRMQNEPRRFAKQTARLMRSGASLAGPLLGLVLVGSRIVAELFGPQWQGAIPVMRILAAAGIARVAVIYANPIQQASGHAHRAAASLWFASAVAIGSVAIFGATMAGHSVESNVRGIAIARLVAQAGIVAPVFMVLIAGVASTTVSRLVSAILPSLVVTAAVIAVGLSADTIVSRTGLALVEQGIVVGGISGAVALVGVVVTNEDAKELILDLRARALRSST